MKSFCRHCGKELTTKIELNHSFIHEQCRIERKRLKDKVRYNSTKELLKDLFVSARLKELQNKLYNEVRGKE